MNYKKILYLLIGKLTSKKVYLVTAIVLICWFYLLLPNQLFKQPTCFVITDANGELLNAAIAADGQWRFPYNKQVPDKFIQCITQFEDKRFYYHPGVDVIGIGRALIQNIKHKKTISGGSTISMQVIRLYKQNNQRTIWNKLEEMLLAIRLECSYKKRSILALYASNAPFGSNVVGLDAASWRYYGRNAYQLSWGEMAALAVLPNAPSLVHPGKNKQILLRKRNSLLQKLADKKIIDATTAYLAMQEPLPSNPKPLPQLAPHLLQRFKKDYLHTLQNTSPTIITTTLQTALQEQVNNLVLQQHEKLKGNQINNLAAMVVDNTNGNILAYVGNVYKPNENTLESYVDVLASPRSPGSTLKPILYAAALTDGILLPKQLLPDIPTQIGGYMPANFDLSYDGAVPANAALARSLNIPAVRLLQQYKYQRFYDFLKNCGINTLSKPADFYGLSLILGGCEVTPYELAGIYSSMVRTYNGQFSNGGKWDSKYWYMPKYTANSFVNTNYDIPKVPLFDFTSMWHSFNAMTDVMRPGEEGLWTQFNTAQRIAWKTGTSFGFRDAWAVGITQKYCVVVWAGNTTGEGRPDLIGVNVAAPLMFDVFRLLPSSAWFLPPLTSFKYLPVCSKSGYRSGQDCASADTIMVSKIAENAPLCPYCKKIGVNTTATFRVTTACFPASQINMQSYFVLPPTMEYYYQKLHPDYKVLPNFLPGCESNNAKQLDIIYPEDLAKIYIPLEMNGQPGKTIFTATHRQKNRKLFWHLDNNFLAATQNFHQVACNPSIGLHTITIVDEDGNSVSRNFEIIGKDRR